MRQTRSRTKNVSLNPETPNSITNAREFEELKKIIWSFTIFELQAVLDYSPQNLTRKPILRENCLKLLQTNFAATQDKIRKILNSPNSSSHMFQPNMNMMVTGQAGNGTVAHTNGMTVPPYNLTQGYPIHPDVRLRKLAFFDVMATLLKPSTLVPINTQRVQEGTYYFHLTPQQATDIASNRDIRNSSKVEHVIQVQLRFCLLETSCEQEDYFPPNVVVKVNNKLCALPNPIPTNKPGVEPKRPPRPVNITTNVKLSPTVANHISVSWCTEYTRGYVVSAYLVKKLSSAQLLHRMKTKGIKPSDFTRGLIKEKLNEDADCEIATTMLKVSLVCPLGKMRMITPCRSSTCSHLQCFDASLYLQMNERKPTWNCPVCDKPAIYENLVIDGYFQEVLGSSSLAPDSNEIQLHKDGSWSTHVLRCDTENLDTPSKVFQKVEVISDDVEVITTDPPKFNIIKTPAALFNEPTSTTGTDSTSVDLTLSDSDDETPLKNKQIPKSVVPAAAPVAKPNDLYLSSDISIISLDSPSPPSSPVSVSNTNTMYVGTTTSSMGVSSTTTQQNCNMPTIVSNGMPSTNYQINPMALSRFDGHVDPLETQIPASIAYQRLTQPQLNTQPKNLNIVHPYREDNRY